MLHCGGNQACAGITGSYGLQMGQAPVLELLQHLSLIAAVPCPVSLCSCCYAGDAVAFKPGRADDNCLLPLHVHGVGASMASPSAVLSLPSNSSSLLLTCLVSVQGFWWILCWPLIPDSERPSMEEGSLLCESWMFWAVYPSLLMAKTCG